MKHENIRSQHQGSDDGRSIEIMRAPIDQHHFLELTFSDGADTQYRVVHRDLDDFYHTVNETQHRSPSERAFARMMELFNLYERAIAVWYRSGKHDDGAKLRRLRDAYQQAVDRWNALQ